MDEVAPALEPNAEPEGPIACDAEQAVPKSEVAPPQYVSAAALVDYLKATASKRYTKPELRKLAG